MVRKKGGTGPTADHRSQNNGIQASQNNGSSFGNSSLVGKINQPKFMSSIPPLLLEGVNLNKMQVSDLIKQHLKDTRVLDIQLNRSGMFTLYAGDASSFNHILDEFAAILATHGQSSAKVYVPRSIQRIQDTEKVAFVKRVDLEIAEGCIKEALKDVGLEAVDVARLINRDKNTPTRTVKITFSDAQNRNTFVRTGLQIDSMHFVAEAANHNTKPIQCYLCLQYNHIAKYCKTKEQVCARCGEKHNVDKCNAASDACKCISCKGNHLATSNECPAYKEQEKRLVNAVNKYSSTAISTNGQSSCSINSSNDFPSLPSTSQQPFNWIQNNMFDELIKILSSKMEKMIEETTTRIFSSLQKRLKKIEKIVQEVENDNESGHIISSSESSSEDENPKKSKIHVTSVAQAKALAEKYHPRVSSLPPPEERTTSTSKTTTTTRPKMTTTTNEASSSKTPSKKKEAKPKQKRNRSPNSSFEVTATTNKGQKTSGNEN
jgi:hypothetical protein